MKYNPVTNTIDRPDGTPYLHLAPGIGAQEAYQIADTLLQAPEWEKEKEELEEQIGKLEEKLEDDLEHRENVADELSEAQAEIERLEGSKVELTQARLRIEELEAMLASAEAALKAEADEQEDMRMERDLLS